MTYETIRKITITEEERKTVRDIINFIEDSFSLGTESNPELVTEIMNGIYCGNDLIYTDGYGEVLVEYKKNKTT